MAISYKMYFIDRIKQFYIDIKYNMLYYIDEKKDKERKSSHENF